MRVLLRDRVTWLYVGRSERVKDRAQAADFRHVPLALKAAEDLTGRERLDILLDFGDAQYDVTVAVQGSNYRLPGAHPGP